MTMAGGTTTGRTAGHIPLDVERVRADFPILQRVVRGCRLAYLDNAATAQKPLAVADAVRDFYLAHNANVMRGVHLLSEEATGAYDRSRETVRRFLHAASTDEVVFTHGTTAGINMVAQAWGGANLHAGDEVVLTVLEHHSNIVPWQMVAHRTGAILKVVPLMPDGSLDMEAYRLLVSDRTRIVAVSQVSNVLGTVAPVAEIAALAHQAGAVVLVDGAQSVPHLPVDVQALDCDFFVFSGHKLYGPTGVGVLYGKRAQLERMPPWQTGGGMIETVTFEATSWAPPPVRFEAGTPPIASVIGLGVAIEYLEGLGLDAIADHEEALLDYATDELAAIPGLRILGTARRKLGVLSFVLGEIHPHDLGTVLDAQGVAVRAGHHCAQPLMKHLRLPATVRASLGIYNTREDIDQLVAGLHDARRRFGS